MLTLESVTEIRNWGDLEPVRRDYDIRLNGQPATLEPPHDDVPAFEARTGCPRCKHLAVHTWREPHVIPPKQVDAHGIDQTHKMWLLPHLNEFRDRVADAHGLPKRGPRKVWVYFPGDESRYTVIRQCHECGHEWGQA
ncbi:hypothetical protein 7S3_74 [uncultured Caudovirales phage]|uniref:Uncharacterized protein n=1 Tax=uncultured Caudovirales phage TaxID=2100421 RepID=A0A2H4J2E4_9CAUD|nr:hypothetical protein 7S3_74 [uncultured Caudovirales phage]